MALAATQYRHDGSHCVSWTRTRVSERTPRRTSKRPLQTVEHFCDFIRSILSAATLDTAFPSCFLQARSQCGPGHAFLMWKPHISDVSKTENKRYSPSIASCRLWSTNGLGYRICSSAGSRLASSKVLDGRPPYFPCLRLPTRVHGRLTKSSLCNRGGYGSPSKILQPQPTTNSRPLISNLSTRTHTHVFFAHG